ncbi:MAG: DinB family protein [Thermoanaerobaculia bacterium]|nr:DinB family protein [Thermoanaerobaculia bacterium]
MRIHIKITRLLLTMLLVGVFTPGAAVSAKEQAPATAAPGANPISTHNNFTYRMLQKIVLGAAEKTPEGNYGFKPRETVRSFGQIVGHMADAQYTFCSVARREKNPRLNIEGTKATKADLIAALKDAFSYCDKAYVGMTDASAAETVKFGGADAPILGVLTMNQVHTTEHYGNLVTYMRMIDLVPPTSDPEFMKSLGR